MELDKKQQERILAKPVRRIMDALRAAGFEARAVGGAVRDGVLGRAIGDIDMAANLPPDKVTEILEKNGIKTAPTGIAHGTVTAIIDHVGYEITSLRRDVATDGRHAKVEFTDDWKEDAARRDFTMNALYLDVDGRLYDYFGGGEDARAGRVHFIGDARARIGEDHLRILRFFRFYAWFGKGEADKEGLAACRELAGLIPQLSAERVAREAMKLLAAENPLPAWKLMSENGVLQQVASEAADLKRLRALLDNEKKYREPATATTRLAALLPSDEKIAAAVATRLKFSNADRDTITALAKLPALLRGKLDPVPLQRLLYAHGVKNIRAAVFLNGENIGEALEVIEDWDNPVFPLKGEDIVRLGIKAGPRVGEILREVEAWWIEGDFKADKKACQSYAQKFTGAA